MIIIWLFKDYMITMSNAWNPWRWGIIIVIIIGLYDHNVRTIWSLYDVTLLLPNGRIIWSQCQMLETHGGESDLASSLAPRVPSCPPAVAWYCTILQSYNPTHYILCMPPIIMAPSIQYDIQYTIMYFSTLPTIYCAWHPEWLLALEPQNLPSCRQLQMVRSDTETLPLLILLFLVDF